MKIVQFKDGKYGIRKWTIFGYRFLGSDIDEDYWWGLIKEYIPIHASMTRAEVIDRWKRFPLKKKRKIWDNGEVIKLEELGQ